MMNQRDLATLWVTLALHYLVVIGLYHQKISRQIFYASLGFRWDAGCNVTQKAWKTITSVRCISLPRFLL